MQIDQAINGNRKGTYTDLTDCDVWCEVYFLDLYNPIVKWSLAPLGEYPEQGSLEASF
jgi:hypothetical protein